MCRFRTAWYIWAGWMRVVALEGVFRAEFWELQLFTSQHKLTLTSLSGLVCTRNVTCLVRIKKVLNIKNIRILYQNMLHVGVGLIVLAVDCSQLCTELVWNLSLCVDKEGTWSIQDRYQKFQITRPSPPFTQSPMC